MGAADALAHIGQLRRRRVRIEQVLVLGVDAAPVKPTLAGTYCCQAGAVFRTSATEGLLFRLKP